MQQHDYTQAQLMDVAMIERDARELRAQYLRDLTRRGIARVAQWLRPRTAPQH